MTKKQGNWKNRIVESGVLAAGEFAANPLNWRRHPAAQADALTGALNELGWIQEVIVNRTTGNMIDGHLRVTLALRQGDDTPVPVKYVELTPDEERLALLTLDPIAAMAAADKAKLDALMQDINTGEAGLQAMFAELAETNGLYAGDDKAGQDTEPQINKAEELRQKWGVEPGMMWQLGEHRIICGDCTDPAVVARVMGGERAEMMFTDPPYRYKPMGENGAFAAGHKKLKSDIKDLVDFNPSKFLEILPKFFDIGINAFIFCNTDLVPDYCIWAKQNGYNFNILVWHKKSFIPASNNHHFPDTEYLIYVSKNATFNSGLNANYGKYWVMDNEKNETHPTIKPLRIIEDELLIASSKNGIVADPFSGSGTTIIACENLNRRCRAIEIDAGYVSVSLQRWADHTGKTPVLIQHISTA